MVPCIAICSTRSSILTGGIAAGCEAAQGEGAIRERGERRGTETDAQAAHGL